MKFTQQLRLRSAFAVGVSAMAMLAAPAMAQDDAKSKEDNQGRNPEIVVTAQFREQALQDTPLSITAVDSALLEARNQTDLAQVANQAPNVTLNSMGGAYGASLGASIRGIGQFDFNPAYEPGVGLYIDDVYYPTLTGANFDLLDLDRVEILRGPQGTLTGRNSIGGAIKMFSKKPDGNTGGYVVAGYGTRDYLELRGSFDVALTDSLFMRVSGVHKQQDGYVQQIDYGCANPGNSDGILPATGNQDCVVDDLGNVNYSGVRASLRYADGGPIEVMVIADYIDEKRNSAAEVVSLTGTGTGGVNTAPYACGPYCTYASWYLPAGGQTGAWSPGNDMRFTGWGLSGHIDIELADNLQLQSITAYREYNNTWGTDDDFGPNPTNGAQGYNDLDFWFFSQELRLNGSIGDLLDYTVGGFYSDQRSTYATRQDIRYIAPGLNFQFDGNDPINADSKAVFATVIAHPVEAMSITGGIRYTDEHKDYTFVRKNYDGTTSTFLGALDGLTATYDGSKWDYRISADYRFSPQVLVYANVGTGFKGGGVTARPFDAAQALNGSFGPETVTAYELGLKTDLLDRRLRLNLAGFINDYKDIQLPLISCASLGSNAPCGARQNAGDGRIKGFEAELMAEPTDGLMIDGSLSYITGKFTRIDAAVGNAILASDPLTTPNWKWSFGIQYKVDLGNAGTLTPRFDMSYTGKTSAGRISAGQPIEYFDSYTLANARITWSNADDDFEISLEGRNIFDKYYTPFRFVSVYAFSGTGYSQVGRPREWMLTAKKTF
ncbi:MAG: TonB-dependent receptor [Sphingomonadales bacterium]|nr:TonB-dependent receptor [Sphingomonadales bacterium]MBD3773533.1 TonB-dependent receptor [Paracoccaceae bacterium]